MANRDHPVPSKPRRAAAVGTPPCDGTTVSELATDHPAAGRDTEEPGSCWAKSKKGSTKAEAFARNRAHAAVGQRRQEGPRMPRSTRVARPASLGAVLPTTALGAGRPTPPKPPTAGLLIVRGGGSRFASQAFGRPSVELSAGSETRAERCIVLFRSAGRIMGETP